MVSSPQHRFDPATLKRTYPVADVIARYGIRLRPSGRALIGRCPFHVDRGRPNLYVYPQSHSWYCYRCAIGGDVIEFVQRQEGIGFAAACERLAQLPPPATASSTTSVTSQPNETRRWDRLPLDEQVVMNTACAIYQHALWREPRALAYLRERAIPDWVIRACGLGYADGHTLEAYLRRRFGLRLAQELGLLGTAGRRDGGRPLREFLAGRIVVPELRGGRCIWFIGRQLDDSADRPKYLALSGERPVLGLERAAGANEVFLCEGVFDYLTAVSWQLPAWSPCGTHLPAERMGFLRRARVVYGVLDGDAPGQAAAARFAEQYGARWRPLCLPDGCDLNDLGRQPGGRATFFRELNAVRRGTRMDGAQPP
jgi:DNA primase catalytic core